MRNVKHDGLQKDLSPYQADDEFLSCLWPRQCLLTSPSAARKVKLPTMLASVMIGFGAKARPMANPTILTDRFDRALLYATHVHGGQVRKGTSTPYVAHLLAVAATVLEYGGDEDLAIAALLHDSGRAQQANTGSAVHGQTHGIRNRTSFARTNTVSRRPYSDSAWIDCMQ